MVWAAIWNLGASRCSALGWLVPAVLVVCLVLLGVMLVIWQTNQNGRFFGRAGVTYN